MEELIWQNDEQDWDLELTGRRGEWELNKNQIYIQVSCWTSSLIACRPHYRRLYNLSRHDLIVHYHQHIDLDTNRIYLGRGNISAMFAYRIIYIVTTLIDC